MYCGVCMSGLLPGRGIRKAPQRSASGGGNRWREDSKEWHAAAACRPDGALYGSCLKKVATYDLVNMLFKSIFNSAQYSSLIRDNPTERINAKGEYQEKRGKVTMDIYAKAKYNRLAELSEVVNSALKPKNDSDES